MENKNYKFEHGIYLFSQMKEFDTFSFKAKTNHEESFVESEREKQPLPKKDWKHLSYRFQQTQPTKFVGKYINEPQFIHQKINKIDQQLSQNIKRRIQLQKKMYAEKQHERQRMNEEFFKQHKIESQEKMGEKFSKMQKKSDYVQTMLRRSQIRIKEMQEEEKAKKDNSSQKNHKKKEKKVIPCQIKVQELLKKVTFPQMPKQNVHKLERQCATLAIHNEHSDLSYMLMVLNFHGGNYKKVRDYYRQIIMFQAFEPNAHWVACQAQFQLENYQLCLKLADKCMKQLSDKHLPRFIFLQARSYERIGNFINSIVCYNQLIKIRPKIPQFYLERAMIYDKIGYPKEAKEDYLYFSVLMPDSKQFLKEKILTQTQEGKRRQLLKALAKLS